MWAGFQPHIIYWSYMYNGHCAEQIINTDFAFWQSLHHPWRIYLTKVQQSFQSNRTALIAGGHPWRRCAKATLDDCWNAMQDSVIGTASSEKMWQNLRSQSRPPLNKPQVTSLPRQCFARFAVFGFLWFKTSPSGGLVNVSVLGSLLMQWDRISLTSVPGSWSCQCLNRSSAFSDNECGEEKPSAEEKVTGCSGWLIDPPTDIKYLFVSACLEWLHEPFYGCQINQQFKKSSWILGAKIWAVY